MGSHKKNEAVRIRLAQAGDVRELAALIEASVRGLQAGDYTAAQRKGALGYALGVDTQLIEDRTYFVAEAVEADVPVMAGCGGWSGGRTLRFGETGPSCATTCMSPTWFRPSCGARRTICRKKSLTSEPGEDTRSTNY